MIRIDDIVKKKPSAFKQFAMIPYTSGSRRVGIPLTGPNGSGLPSQPLTCRVDSSDGPKALIGSLAVTARVSHAWKFWLVTPAVKADFCLGYPEAGMYVDVLGTCALGMYDGCKDGWIGDVAICG